MKKKKVVLEFLFRLGFLSLLMIVFCRQRGYANTSSDSSDPFNLAKSSQLIVVISKDWDSVQAEMFVYTRLRGQWKLQFTNPVVLGKTGLAAGDGRYPDGIRSVPVKREGDGKSPAGFFTIGNAFGYARKSEIFTMKIPYTCCSDTVFCIDDPHSVYYNKIIGADTVKHDWNSFEYMHRKDVLYRWGIFINYNSDPPIASKGSCIFFHIWSSPAEGTSGCTAMQEEHLLRILHWIDSKKDPVLVQLPRSVYLQIREKYHLPVINRKL